MSADYFILIFCFWISLSLRINDIYIPDSQSTLLLIILAPLIAIPIFFFFGLYKSLIRYSNFMSLISITQAISIYTLIWFLLVLFSGIVVKPYNFLFINWICSIFFTGLIRYSARWFLLRKDLKSSNVIIFGAGSAGVQLKYSLNLEPNLNVIGFIDNNEKLHGQYIEGIRIYDPIDLEKIVEKENITEVLVAIPSLSRSNRNELLQSLKKYPITIKILPNISDLAHGKISFSDLKRIKIEDLLNRDIREPDKHLMSKSISNKNVLVTGAGGSIGSELCRQILKQNPKSIILYEINEYRLYEIDRELKSLNQDIEIVPVMGNILNQDRFSEIVKQNQIHTIYHAAAYKHVPLVESNIISSVETNILGTYRTLIAAIENSVESFVYISTDKAVRPTNIMGASKRFAELMLQSITSSMNDDAEKISISMVRFGNVLGSSGSVVPLFTEQIKSGGPITVTDPKIIRYFMTISEAAELVIQAGSMPSNSDIFILDMGEPVEVLKLAKDMIRLSGMSVRDSDHPDGDIEIVFTGLRPGEKLYEELLVDDKSLKTSHEKIFKAQEEPLSWENVSKFLHLIETGLSKNNENIILDVFDEAKILSQIIH